MTDNGQRIRDLAATLIQPATNRWNAAPSTPKRLDETFPYPWPEARAQELCNLLVTLFPTEAAVSTLVSEAGMNTGYVDMSGAIKYVWHNVLNSAGQQGVTKRLLAVAADKATPPILPKLERCQGCGRQITGEKMCRECRGSPARLSELFPLNAGTTGRMVVEKIDAFLADSHRNDSMRGITILTALAKLEDDGIDAFLAELANQPLPDNQHTSIEPLIKLLISAYSSTGNAQAVAAMAGINLTQIPGGTSMGGAIDPLWRGILQAAENQGKLLRLLRETLADRGISAFHKNIVQWMESQGLKP